MVKVVLGETCPALMHYWDPKECQAIKQTDGKWAVMDWSIQTVVAIADTRKEADDFIIGKGGGQPDERDFDTDEDYQEALANQRADAAEDQEDNSWWFDFEKVPV